MAVEVLTESQMHHKMHREGKESAERAEIGTLLREQRLIKNEVIRREIIENGRIDILAKEVLGYFILDFHKKIMKHQYRRKKSLTLAPRDSGKCVKVTEKIATTEGYIEIGKVQPGNTVLTLGPELKIGESVVLAKLDMGVKPCYILKTRTGREIIGTEDHRYLHFNGWKQLKEFKIGDRIAVPRVVPILSNVDYVSENQAKLLAYMIADGDCFGSNFTKSCEIVIEDFILVSESLGFQWRREFEPSRICLRNGIRDFLRKFNLFRVKSRGKWIPPEVFQSTKKVKAAFLNRLFSCDGHMGKMNFEITFSSKKLIQDIQRLLLHFGIISRFTYKLATCQTGEFDAWRLQITDYENLKKLSDEIGLFVKQKYLDEWLDKADDFKPNPCSDTIPIEYKKHLIKSEWWHRQNSNLRIDGKYAIGREKIKRLAIADDNKAFHALAESDIFWDKIESITFDGEHETCDIQVADNQNFICEDFFTHNSTICNYTKIIFEILRNPNVRIGLISNTQKQAEGFLKEIKNHLEGNGRLIEIFGTQVGPKWDTKEIVVKSKDSKHKDSTVSCIGVGSALIGKHFDMIVMDDAVTEEASRTELQRDRQRVWFYQSLAPTMEPHAELHIIGTRYHYLDLYGHVMGHTEVEGAGELKNDFIRIKSLEFKVDKDKPILDDFGEHKRDDGGDLRFEPVLDENGEEILLSYFPEKHTVEYLLNLKSNMGTVIFNAQYQNDTTAMKGVIFKNQYFRYYTDAPKNLKIYQGVDLAVGEKDSANKFAHVTIGIDDEKNVYVLNYYERRGIRPKKQTQLIAERFKDNDCLWVGIESNAYQEAKAMDVVDFDPTVMVKKVYTDLDKITKGWKVAALFEAGKVFIHISNHRKFMDHFLLFTGERGGDDDLFDAFFNCLKIAFWSRTKRNRRRFGVL